MDTLCNKAEINIRKRLGHKYESHFDVYLFEGRSWMTSFFCTKVRKLHSILLILKDYYDHKLGALHFRISVVVSLLMRKIGQQNDCKLEFQLTNREEDVNKYGWRNFPNQRMC